MIFSILKMVQEFKYIHVPSASYIKWEKADILALNIPTDKLAKYTIIRNETSNKYHVYNKDKASIKQILDISKKDTVHEVIFGNVAQKLKFDIDAYLDNLIQADSIINEIVIAICDQFYDSYFTLYGDYIEASDIFIAESCGNVCKDGVNKYKASYHIIVAPHKFAVATNEEAAGFASQVILRLSEEAIKVIDYSINKSIQNFRMLNSAKMGSNRIKKYKSGPIMNYTKSKGENELLTSLITYCDSICILPRIYIDSKIKFTPVTEKLDINNSMLKNILELAADYTDGFEVRTVMNNMIVFDRVKPSFCKFCNETHNKDNTLVLFINKGDNDEADNPATQPTSDTIPADTIPADMIPNTNDAISIYSLKYGISVMCRHNKVMKYLGVIEPPAIEKESLDRILFDRANKFTLTDNLDEIKQREIYSDPALRDYKRCKTLFIKAPMKMGKTKKLREFIINEHPHERNSRIVVISFRRSFTDEFHSKYSDLGFVTYSDIDGLISNPRVIIQAESLHRLNITADPIDLLILDESESIIEQIDSGLFTNFTKSFAAFQWLLKTASQVICMDALLGDRTYNVIQRLRGDEDLILQHNTFKNATDDVYKMTADFGKWLALLHESLTNGERVAIDSNSLKDAEVIKELIAAKFPKLKIGMYSSKTYASIKKEHMSNVNHYWKQFDVLIKTPTISAGVSFEEEHFDRVFGFFIGITCTTQTCIQMMGRVRNVKTKEYCIYVKPNGTLNLPVKRDIILLLLKMRHKLIMDNIDMAQLSFSYKDNGEIEIYNSYYIALWLENVVNKNLNRNNFYGMLMHYIKTAGAHVMLLESQNMDSNGLAIECRDLKQAIAAEELENIAGADNIDNTKASELFERKRNQDDISDQEHYQLEKYVIREHYNIKDVGKMTPDFLKIYKDRRIKNAYKNTNLFKDVVTGKRDYDDVLNDCRDNDIIYKNAIPLRFEIRADTLRTDKNTKTAIQQTKTSVIDAYDVNHRYTYDKVKCLTWLLNCCGWQGPFDTTAIDENTIIDNIMKNREAINKVESINMIISLFDINWRLVSTDRTKVMRSIKYNMNRILRDLFDISFVKVPKTKYDILSYYQLKASDNFVINENQIDVNFNR